MPSRNYLDAVLCFNGLLELCRERKVLSNVSLHVAGCATAKYDRLHPFRVIWHFQKLRAFRELSHRIACDPPVFALAGPTVNLYMQGLEDSVSKVQVCCPKMIKA